MANLYYRKLTPSRVFYCALSEHYGFNYQYGLILQERAGLSLSTKVSKISKGTLKFMELSLKRMKVNRLVGKELRIKTRTRLTFYRMNGSYRGLRMRQCLPSRGQRTKTNARTSKRRYSKKTHETKSKKTNKR